jgi:O-antigen ligase
VDAWLVVLGISSASPIIGLGFANYYWYAKVFTIRGYHIKFNSHSQFVDIVAQTGILGLICFFWILTEVGRLAYKLMDRLPPGFAKGYAYGVFASVFGSLMAAFLVDWLLPFAYNIGLDGVRASILPWIFFGGLISLEQIYLVKQKTDPDSLREQRLKPIKA